MNWLLNRLREASTWRGMVWLLTALGVTLKPEQIDAITVAGVTLAGLLGVFLSDTTRVEPNDKSVPKVVSEVRNPSNHVVHDWVRQSVVPPYDKSQSTGSDKVGWNG
jgi:hypothetical protein